ncbi:MAG: stage III sporulation protein AC [Ruminococcus sp.]|nr:stage III sporulation protein AC [Ruminococcus sp.]MDY3894694.1 stage III sporulation protein AC [Candidatus Fimenecus sp.]HAQ28584.1 stage III sporulation protein AC [Oscillospiraceae bacterium]
MEVDFIFKIAAIGIIVAVLYQVLSRSGREEYATLTVIAGIVVIVMMLLPGIGDLRSIIDSTFDI